MKTIYVVAVVVGLVACVTDLRTRRIPNVLTYGAAAAALAFHAATGGFSGFSSACAGLILGVIVFFLPFVLGGMGGGDVKLLGALGAWLGPMQVVWLALYTGVAGGILAVVVALAHGYLRRALANVWLLLTHWQAVGISPVEEISLSGSPGPRLAYAVPIFVGTLVTIWLHY